MSDSFYVRYGKRCFDTTAAFAGLLLLCPVFVLLAAAICIESRGGPFFLQQRAGKRGKAFRIVKFRTMRQATTANAPLITARGDSRITRVGRLLRASKVDELPQLINVLLGDMSLVGPRPEVAKYTALYDAAQRQILNARPGITGPAALAYSNEEELLAEVDDREKFYVATLLPAKAELDVKYCEKITLGADVTLVVKTLLRMAGVRDGARGATQLAAQVEKTS